jgi:hypothetical protein
MFLKRILQVPIWVGFFFGFLSFLEERAVFALESTSPIIYVAVAPGGYNWDRFLWIFTIVVLIAVFMGGSPPKKEEKKVGPIDCELFVKGAGKGH